MADWDNKITGVRRKFEEVHTQRKNDEARKEELTEKRNNMAKERDYLKEEKADKVELAQAGNHKARQGLRDQPAEDEL